MSGTTRETRKKSAGHAGRKSVSPLSHGEREMHRGAWRRLSGISMHAVCNAACPAVGPSSGSGIWTRLHMLETMNHGNLVLGLDA